MRIDSAGPSPETRSRCIAALEPSLRQGPVMSCPFCPVATRRRVRLGQSSVQVSPSVAWPSPWPSPHTLELRIVQRWWWHGWGRAREAGPPPPSCLLPQERQRASLQGPSAPPGSMQDGSCIQPLLLNLKRPLGLLWSCWSQAREWGVDAGPLRVLTHHFYSSLVWVLNTPTDTWSLLCWRPQKPSKCIDWWVRIPLFDSKWTSPLFEKWRLKGSVSGVSRKKKGLLGLWLTPVTSCPFPLALSHLPLSQGRNGQWWSDDRELTFCSSGIWSEDTSQGEKTNRLCRHNLGDPPVGVLLTTLEYGGFVLNYHG